MIDNVGVRTARKSLFNHVSDICNTLVWRCFLTDNITFVDDAVIEGKVADCLIDILIP